MSFKEFITTRNLGKLKEIRRFVKVWYIISKQNNAYLLHKLNNIFIKNFLLTLHSDPKEFVNLNKSGKQKDNYFKFTKKIKLLKLQNLIELYF
jgi:hypothetical protein